MSRRFLPLTVKGLAGLVTLGLLGGVVGRVPVALAQEIPVRVKPRDGAEALQFTLALRATINGQATAQRVRILDKADKPMLPLLAIIKLFDFPIAMDVRTDEATGYFAKPENVFDLDLITKRVRSGAKTLSIAPGDLRREDGELYVSIAALQAWLGIETTLDRARLYVHFTTPYPLPQQAQEARKKRRFQQLGPMADIDDRFGKDMPVSPAFDLMQMAVFFAGELSTQTRTLQGTTTPHDEVELYHNGKLEAFHYADDAGRYSFKDIPLFIGANDFRIAIYGRYGAYEERTEHIDVQAPPASAPSPAPASAPVSKPPVRDVETVQAPRPVAPVVHQRPPAPAGLSGGQAIAQNWVVLSVVQKDRETGKLEAYSDRTGTFLRLDAFVRALGLPLEQQVSPDILSFKSEDGVALSVDLAHAFYAEGGQSHALSGHEAFKNEDKIYVATDLLYRLLPTSRFIVDLAQKKINIEPHSAAKQGVPSPDKRDLAPVPDAAPVQPVIVDDMQGGQRVTGNAAPPAPEVEAGDVIHLSQPVDEKKTAQTGADEEAVDEDKEGETLVVQPQIKMLPPQNEYVEAVVYGGRVFVPLNDLIRIIGFPIHFDDSGSQAHGFFFDPDSTFKLNMNDKEVRVGDKRYDLTRRDVRMREGQVYASLDSISLWFGLGCDLDRTTLILHLTTDRLFPAEEKEQRQKQWNKLLMEVNRRKEDDLPLLQNDYQLYSPPSIDVALGSLYRQQDNTKSWNNNYNIQGAMELGYLTSQFYAQGSTQDRAIDVLRVQAGRKDASAGLLGGLHATEFSFGDVTAPSVSLVTNSALGRGVVMTNRNLSAAENFDVRTFTGDSTPGYEVELYRNNVLVSFQVVDANGRYRFTDIPILYGENTFRLVFYGPQGQREERVETVSASQALLKKGKFEYTVGAQQRGESLLPIHKQTTTSDSLPNGTELVSGFRYGLFENYTLGATVDQTELSDGPHRYATASSGVSLGGLLSETSFAKDMTSGGWASGLSVLTGFESVSLRLKYRRYSDFVSEAVNAQDAPLKSQANVDANTQLLLPFVHDIGFGLSALREEFVASDLEDRYTYGLRLSKSLWGLGFTNVIDYIRQDASQFQDTFGVQTRLWGVNLRTTGIYEVMPDARFSSASVMADYVFTKKLSGQTQIQKDMTLGKTTFGQNLSWDFDTFRLSLSNQFSDQGDFSVGLNVSFSLAHDGATNKWKAQTQATTTGGSVAGRVFIDENNNGVYDEGEKYVPDTTVRINRAAAELDENGYFVTPVSPYEVSKVEIDTSHVQDPLLTPETKGYRVITRPGDSVIADFPMVRTTIIDGTTYVLDKDGEKHELGQIVVELQDKDHKPLRRVVSELDGYFTFDKIRAGEYWITVPDEVLTSYNATIKTPLHVHFDKVDEFISGNDIVLEQKTDLTVPPAFKQATPEDPPPSLPPPAPAQPDLPRPVREEKASKTNEDVKDHDEEKAAPTEDPPDGTGTDSREDELFVAP